MNSWPIVGSYYRPPAKAVLEVLAIGTALILRPEPDNAVDANAVMVVLKTSDIPQGKAREMLQHTLPGYGLTLEELLAQEEIHLGYVPAKSAVELAPRLNGREAQAELRYSPDGKEQVALKEKL